MFIYIYKRILLHYENIFIIIANEYNILYINYLITE